MLSNGSVPSACAFWAAFYGSKRLVLVSPLLLLLDAVRPFAFKLLRCFRPGEFTGIHFGAQLLSHNVNVLRSGSPLCFNSIRSHSAFAFWSCPKFSSAWSGETLMAMRQNLAIRPQWWVSPVVGRAIWDRAGLPSTAWLPRRGRRS